MTTFIKPDNVRYVDMCMYIDTHIYNDDITIDEQNLIYEYLYHIAYMLAVKQCFFKDRDTYDKFALYLATEVYMRLINPKQYITNNDGTAKMTKLKSVLNYMKVILYPRKVSFEQQIYSQCISQSQDDNCTYDIYRFSDLLSDNSNDINLFHFSCYIDDICKTIKQFLSNIPYKDKNTKKNVYISCLLTFLNSVSLSEKTRNRINDLQLCQLWDNNKFYEEYKKQFYAEPILYHLDESMKNYIYVITMEIKHVLSLELSSILNEEISINSNQHIIFDNINGGMKNEY